MMMLSIMLEIVSLCMKIPSADTMKCLKWLLIKTASPIHFGKN